MNELLSAELRRTFEKAVSSETRQISPSSLTPLSIWSFVGVFDADSPGKMQHKPDGEVDQEQLKDDVVLCRSLYQDFIVSSSSVQHALKCVCLAAFSQERERDALTTATTYNQFENMRAEDALPAIGMALQANFEYVEQEGLIAVFSLADTLDLLTMQFSKLMKEHYHLAAINPDFIIPIEDQANINVKCMRVLQSVGERLVPFLYGRSWSSSPADPIATHYPSDH